MRIWQDILVGLEDLEGRDNLSKSNALVSLPLLVVLRAVNVDEEVVSVALVVDDRLLNTAASHVVLVGCGSWWLVVSCWL